MGPCSGVPVGLPEAKQNRVRLVKLQVGRYQVGSLHTTLIITQDPKLCTPTTTSTRPDTS